MKLLAFFIYIICSSTSYSQTLVIGSSKYNPPFESWANKDNLYYAYGYDIDFMNEICRRSNYSCQYKAFGFDELFTVLKEHKIDLVISSIIVTDSRKRQFAFSLPYLESNAQYMANVNSRIAKITDIHGKKVGARQGTPYGQLAKIVTQNNTIVFYNSIEDMFLALKENKVDVCILDYETAKNWSALNAGIYKLIGKKIPIGDGYAIMLNLDQQNLKEKINRTILEMQEDGTFLRTYSQYF
jgi:arginine transport system substrate-binding protein